MVLKRSEKCKLIRTEPSLQIQEPSMCEQETSLWQEQDEVQLVPYRPAGQLMEQSSPYTRSQKGSRATKYYQDEFIWNVTCAASLYHWSLSPWHSNHLQHNIFLAMICIHPCVTANYLPTDMIIKPSQTKVIAHVCVSCRCDSLHIMFAWPWLQPVSCDEVRRSKQAPAKG